VPAYLPIAEHGVIGDQRSIALSMPRAGSPAPLVTYADHLGL
jgi:hypothetical protein